MSGMESIVENWWNEGNGAYGPPAYNPLKKTVGAASIHKPQINKFNGVELNLNWFVGVVHFIIITGKEI